MKRGNETSDETILLVIYRAALIDIKPRDGGQRQTGNRGLRRTIHAAHLLSGTTTSSDGSERGIGSVLRENEDRQRLPSKDNFRSKKKLKFKKCNCNFLISLINLRKLPFFSLKKWNEIYPCLVSAELCREYRNKCLKESRAETRNR